MKTKMTTFRYHGPDTTVTFRGGPRVRLLKDRDVELPSDSKYVRDLIARKLLSPVEQKATEDGPQSMRARRKAKPPEPAPVPVVEENTPDASSVEKGN